jgi:hypothetical protein
MQKDTQSRRKDPRLDGHNLLRTTGEKNPEAFFCQAVSEPEQGNDEEPYSFQDVSEKELLVVPFIRKALRRPSFVIRERLQNGKLLFFLLDPTFENNAEQPQLLFQEITEHIFNKEPGMSVWKRISVTHRPNTEDRYDRIVLAFASLAMYLTLRQKNQDLFKEEDVSFELTARWSYQMDKKVDAQLTKERQTVERRDGNHDDAGACDQKRRNPNRNKSIYEEKRSKRGGDVK